MHVHEKQKGVIVLAVSLVILLLMGIFALMFEVRSVKQIKISATFYRGEQALVAAEAGLNYGVAYVIETPTGDSSPSNTELPISVINNHLGSNAGQVVSITSSELTTNQYKITAVGESADGLSNRTVEHIINIAPQDPENSGYDVTGWKDY